MVDEAAAQAGVDGASFSRIRRRPASSCAQMARAGRRGAVQRVARRAGGAGAGKVHGVGPMLYFLLYEQLSKYVSPFRVFRYTTFRTAFASLTALFLCIALGPVADQQAARVSDRAVHPRGRPEVAPEKGRHADHGRRPDHHLDRVPTLLWADLRYPYVWIALAGAAGLRLDRLPGRLRQDHASSAIWASPAGASCVYQFLDGLRVRRRCCWSCAPTAISRPR